MLRACPIHGQALVDRTSAGERIMLWHPELGDQDVDYPIDDPLGLERYVLGRMDVMPRTFNPFLDEESLADIIRVAVLFGRARDAGALSVPKVHPAKLRSKYAGLGFDILAGGHSGLVKFLVDNAIERGFSPNTSAVPSGVQDAVGWIARALYQLGDCTLASKCKAALTAAAHHLLIFTRRGRDEVTEMPADRLTLQACAAAVRLSPLKCKEVAVRLGLTRQKIRRPQCHAFTNADVAHIRLEVENTLGFDEASAALGLDHISFARLCPEVGLFPLVRLGGVTFRSDRYREADVEGLVSRIRLEGSGEPSDAISFSDYCEVSGLKPDELALQLIRGGRTIVSVNPRERGFRSAELAPPRFDTRPVATETALNAPRGRADGSGLSFIDTAALLGTTINGVRGLVDAGFLRTVRDQSGGRPRVCSDSVSEFDSVYVSARLFARAKGLAPQRIVYDFKQAGVTQLPAAEVGGPLWVDRECVINLFGPDWDLRAVDPFASMIWNRLRDYWTEIGSANRLGSVSGSTARIISGRGTELGTLLVKSTNVELVVRADRSTPNKLQRLRGGFERLSSSWVGLVVKRNQADSMELAQAFSIGQDPGAIGDALIALDNIATALRTIIDARPIQ